DLLNVDIVYDLRPVHGDTTLAAQFIEYAYDRGQAEPVFAKLLGEQMTTGNPFTVFGGFQLEDGRLDIKKHGLFPIVATARTLA
ncbi:putative nucleotidyltransferase substrate binding domain-containing protein, partial [Mesorhizobium sp.]